MTGGPEARQVDASVAADLTGVFAACYKTLVSVPADALQRVMPELKLAWFPAVPAGFR
jgi:hypothetical protein